MFQVGEVAFSQENHVVYWGRVLELGQQLTGAPTKSAAEELADLFAAADQQLNVRQGGYAETPNGWKSRPLKEGERALYWNGFALVPMEFAGGRAEWYRPRHTLAEHIVSLAQELGADSFIDIGAGPAVMAPFVSALSKLPVVNLDASAESIAFADLFKARHALPWTNIRVDLLAMIGRPDLQQEMRRLLPGQRPLVFSRRTIQSNYFSGEQLQQLFDWALSIGAVGGVHLEAFGERTAAFETLPDGLKIHLRAPDYDRERDPFVFLENFPPAKIVRRVEIFPQFVAGRAVESLLCWKRR